MAGLLIFIGGMFYALQKYDERNEYLSLKKAGIEIAYSIMEKGVIEPDSFVELCSGRAKPLAEKNMINFAISVQKCCAALETNDRNAALRHEAAYQLCTNGATRDSQMPRNPITLTYPVTIPYKENQFGPAIVNIIVWRG